MDTNLFLSLQDWVLATFNKEAIAIFAILCVSFFGMACYVAFYAWKNGEFSDMEAAKYEAMNL